jgi:hypothetical protein
MAKFDCVPVSCDGGIGLFALLTAAKGSCGRDLWQRAKTDDIYTWLAKIEGVRKKTRVVAGKDVVLSLRAALNDNEFLKSLEIESDRKSLGELMAKDGITFETATDKINVAFGELQDKKYQVTAMRTQLAQMLNVDSVKMRCARNVEGVWIFSRYDAIALMLDNGNEDQARIIWERLVEEYQGHLNNGTVVTPCYHCETFHFFGERQRPTPVTDIKGLIEMLLLVPGQRAMKFRSGVAEIFLRFIGGDLSLIEKIRTLNDMQQQLPPDNPATAFGEHIKRQREDDTLEIQHKSRIRDLEYEERRKRMDADIEAHQKKLDANVRAHQKQLDDEADVRKKQMDAEAAKILTTSHEVFRRERAVTIQENVKTWHTINGELSPRMKRAVDDQLRTSIVGDEQVDAQLGRPIYLSVFLKNELLIKDWAATQRAKPFGRVVLRHVNKMFPMYDTESRTTRSVAGNDRECHLYFEAHLSAIKDALTEYRTTMPPLRTEELTHAGLQARHVSGNLHSFFRTSR